MTSSLGHQYIPCHHYLSLSLSLSCHNIHWLFLCHSRTPLTSMTTIYSTISPFALMATFKHSPPLTTMTKDNLLYQYSTYFDIGFHVFLLSDNSPCHHISPLLTEIGYLIHVLSFNISFATGSWTIT